MVELHSLVEALSDPAAYPRRGPDVGVVPAVTVVHTHISVVFLAGDRAYKVKKPVRHWGFLDYSTVERRRALCEEEVRLNRRLAPDVYLGVVPIVRRDGRLQVGERGGRGEAVEHAVEMVRWPVGATLSDRIHAGRAVAADAVAIARRLRAFHDEAPRDEDVAHEGRPVAFARVWRANFRGSRAQVPEVLPSGLHDAVLRRATALLRATRTRLVRRARERRLVEGHGDLRAEHLVRLGSAWCAVDAIEFSAALRCVDPLSDAAFLVMDLRAHGRPDLADAFEAAWLGDPPDLDARALLPLYLAYRAHVRAGVDAIRSRREGASAEERARDEASARRHLALAWLLSRRGEPPPLVVLVGTSGCGKSAVADAIAPLLDADVHRSDVVRKGLLGLPPTHRPDGAERARLYSRALSGRTYRALVDAARRSLRAGRAAVLDATFLSRSTRGWATEVATRAGSPCAFLSVEAPPDVVRTRLLRRAATGLDASDADAAVHDAQVAAAEPFSPAEAPRVVRWDGRRPPVEAFAAVVEGLAR